MSKISQDAKLDIQADGWHLIGIDPKQLDEAGVNYKIISEPKDEIRDDFGNVVVPQQLSDCLAIHKDGNDYIDEGISILDKLAQIFPSLLK